MSEAKLLRKINSTLEPVLFQVIGSTPQSVMESIKSTNLKDNTEAAISLTTICLFAIAVNKSTMENFSTKSDVSEARPMIRSAFSIQGSPNMTSLTLLGHSLMTTKIIERIDFCKQLRLKFGQAHIWAGNFSTGAVSDKQKGILLEKAQKINFEHAKLLASGFLKYTRIDTSPYTNEEMQFWGIQSDSRQSARAEGSTAGGPRIPIVPPDSVRAHPTTWKDEYIKLSDGSEVLVPGDVVEYYLTALQRDRIALAASIAGRGLQNLINSMRQARLRDPEMRGSQGSTVG